MAFDSNDYLNWILTDHLPRFGSRVVDTTLIVFDEDHDERAVEWFSGLRSKGLRQMIAVVHESEGGLFLACWRLPRERFESVEVGDDYWNVHHWHKLDKVQAHQVEQLLRVPRPFDYDAYLRSPEWQARAERALERAGRRCQLCNAPQTARPLSVHHRTYERIGHELDEDLFVLCRSCHHKVHRNLP